MQSICVKCKKCSKIHSFEIHLDYVGSDERQMGPESFYSGFSEKVCSCGNKMTVLVEGSEYPEGAGIEIFETNITGGTEVNC